MDHEDDDESLADLIEEDEILALFTEDEEKLRNAIRHLIECAREDLRIESSLIDALEVSLDRGCDDSEASVWIAVVLGEARSRNAAGILIRCLSNDEDEMLQDAAGVALLRIGEPAIVLLMEQIDEGRGRLFNQTAYRLLGETGVLEDEPLHRRVLDFLEERLPIESRAPAGESAVEELVAASARLGHRKLLKPFRQLLARRYSGQNPVIEDAIALLEENEEGVPFVPTIEPWKERYGWLLEDERDRARVARPGAGPDLRGMDYRNMFEVPETSEPIEDEDEDEGRFE